MKPNLSNQKTPMPLADSARRAHTFDEVALGYSAEQALQEAGRCLGCKHPFCVEGCPVNVRIPDFIARVKEGDFEGAYDVIQTTSTMPAICGRVCPQESQCEKRCVRGIKGDSVGIGRLERFVADYHLSRATPPPTPPAPCGRRAAIVGSGPASLSCAADLAKAGWQVTVFEALHVAGGVLVYGIPEFRLPKHIVRAEIERLQALGVTMELNCVVGKSVLLDELRQQYDAVFIGSGAGLPKFMNIPGENLGGVYSANEFLTRVNLMKAYLPQADTPLLPMQRVVVVGGGNVAMDAARSALRLGAEVRVVYRRSEAELPARREEVEHAKEEGIAFFTLHEPTCILGDDNRRVCGVRCRHMELGEPDESGRRRPVPIPDSEITLDADAVIMAIGTSPNPLLKSSAPDLDTERWGGIRADGEGRTNLPNVWAGGDAVTGAATVILAMGAGKRAAADILRTFS